MDNKEILCRELLPPGADLNKLEEIFPADRRNSRKINPAVYSALAGLSALSVGCSAQTKETMNQIESVLPCASTAVGFVLFTIWAHKRLYGSDEIKTKNPKEFLKGSTSLARDPRWEEMLETERRKARYITAGEFARNMDRTYSDCDQE